MSGKLGVSGHHKRTPSLMIWALMFQKLVEVSSDMRKLFRASCDAIVISVSVHPECHGFLALSYKISVSPVILDSEFLDQFLTRRIREITAFQQGFCMFFTPVVLGAGGLVVCFVGFLSDRGSRSLVGRLRSLTLVSLRVFPSLAHACGLDQTACTCLCSHVWPLQFSTRAA